MRTILTGIAVSEPARSEAFYTTLGYEIVGRVADAPIGALTMLKLPEEPFVSLELVARRDGSAGGGLDHIAIQVDSLDATVATLRTRGLPVGEVDASSGEGSPRTCTITDPDGYSIELVEWPAGHPIGMTAADFGAAGEDGS